MLVSGGMDSATAAFEARERGYDLSFLHTSYGQNTEESEYECARRQADHLDVEDLLHVETEHPDGESQADPNASGSSRRRARLPVVTQSPYSLRARLNQRDARFVESSEAL